MSTGGSGHGVSNAFVSYDYGTDEKSFGSRKPSMFNGDPDTFSWWKTAMYSHIMGLDEKLWDVLEDGVGYLELDEEGVIVDRKKHTAAQKKINKHHKIRGILVAALPHKEYLKMSDKSATKTMFASLCSNYKGNKKVKEAKATMLVHQYELFKMKEDGDKVSNPSL
jgi:hypothetical protein